MTSKDIEKSMVTIIDNFSREEFIYDLLLAYGSPKATITRLKKGDFNLSKNQGEVLLKSKLFFKVDSKDNLLATAEGSAQDDNILRHKPRFIIVTDFETLLAIDTKTKARKDIKITELPRHYDFFLPLGGSEVYNTKNDNKADREAAYKMAELYDGLISVNEGVYNSKESVHSLNIFLSRLLFCLFAEDTGIFAEDGIFTNSLNAHTQQDGSDVNIFLDQLFERLNTKSAEKFPAYMADKFPYVNGGLFRDNITSPNFTTATRKILIALGELQWQEINPDIFGSMIQAVVLPEYRSNLSMHYTSVENILKLIRPLFLDELYEEFDKHQDNIDRLRKLISRMSKIKLFDPACGSGNFLIITYKELRVLEIEILKRIIKLQTPTMFEYTEIKLSQFYGIELDDFAHEMTILSLWLAEHQMNKFFEERLAGYGESKPILPLKEAGHIICGNATRLKWEDVCPNDNGAEVYVIGNPPYLGYSKQDSNQKKDMEIVFNGISNYKKLDYISCWFYKASRYIQGQSAKFAFVSTNSISQGEQVALLWPHLFTLNTEIEFVYTSFKWTNNAKGNAGVAVVIVGMRNISNKDKHIYYDSIKTKVKNVSPYLANSNNTIVKSLKYPISKLPEMIIGSKISDNGNLLLNIDEKDQLLSESPLCEEYIKKFIGAQEFMHSTQRYCIHFNLNLLDLALKIDQLKDRFKKVKVYRECSKKATTRSKAATPYKFDEDKYVKGDFILVPQTGSEKREYLPIGFFDKTYVPSNATRVIYNAESWIFGMLSSKMHIVWVKAVAGRQKMDPQYSNTLCYNTFPFPDISNKQKESLNLYVFAILDERAKHPEKTMAQLYDPDKMPIGLRQAHKELDEAIERCYRIQPFKNDTKRLEYLFKLYEEMTTKETLFAKQQKKKN